MSEQTKKPTERRGRKSMFHKGRTVSFKTDGDVAARCQKAASARRIPFSMWMREAAEEKLQQETAAS